MIKLRAFNKIILCGIVLTPLVLSEITFACLTGNTFAYFSDVEYSTGNAITAGTWGNESRFLTISESKLTGNGEKLHGITLDVSGTQSVTIDKIQVWWNNSQDEASHLIEIKLDGKEFFDGSKSTGEIIDGTNYVLEGSSSAKLEFCFDSDVSNLAPFTISIIMGDGSVKSVVTDPKYRSDVPEISDGDSGASQVDQEAPVTDIEEGQAEEGQAQEKSVDSQESIPDTGEDQNSQEASTADLDGNQKEIQVGQEGSNTVQDVQKSVTDTGESQDIPETSTIDTEEDNQNAQETLLDEN